MLLLDGEPAALERVLARGHIRLTARGEDAQELAPEERRVMEAVVMAPSPLVDHSPAQLGLRERYRMRIERAIPTGGSPGRRGRPSQAAYAGCCPTGSE